MLPYKSAQDDTTDIPNGISLDSLEAELSLWEDLPFDFEMDEDRGNNKNSRNEARSGQGRRVRSSSVSAAQPSGSGSNSTLDAHDAALLAQFAASAGLQHHAHAPAHDPAYAQFVQTLLASQGPYNQPSHQPGFPPRQYMSNQMGQMPMSFSPPRNPWPQLPLPHASYNPHQHTSHNSLPGPLPMSYGHQLPYPTLPPLNTGGGGLSNQPASHQHMSPPAASPTTPDPNDPASGGEDKRRRNTAASARFRIKKKQRTLNLERSVSDLTGRAEELEREASDLRRENGWLKEIVMLKGSRLAGLNLSPHSMPASSGESSSRREHEGRRAGAQGKEDESESEEGSSSEDEEYRERSSKGKGKGKAKKK